MSAGEDEERTISGAARVEIEEDGPAQKGIDAFVREDLRPALQDVEDDPEAYKAVVLLALREDPDGRRVWTWAHASGDDAPYFIDACLSSMGKLIRGAENRQAAEEANAIVNRAARRRRQKGTE